MTLRLSFSTKPGWENTYVTKGLVTQGAIINKVFCANKGCSLTSDDLREIANVIAKTEDSGEPSVTELFEAHRRLLERNRLLRERVTKLTAEKYISNV